MNPEIWRDVFDAIEDPAFFHDKQFRVLLANAAYCREAGVTEAQALGKPYWEVFPPGTGPLPGCKAAMDRKGHGGSQEEVSVGEKLFLSKSYTACDDQGKSLHALHILSDITERKRAEAALRENQARLDLALRSAGMGVWHWDIIENRRYFDDQVCRLLGIDPATFTGAAEEFFGAVHPDDRETIKASLARTMEQNVPHEREFRAVWPDGSIHYITARGRLVRDDKGRPARISGIAWDITDRKKSEEGLKLFRALVDQSTDAIEVLDPETFRFLDVNQKACLELGYSRDELLSLSAFDIDPMLDRSRITEMTQELRKLGSLTHEGRHRRKDGVEFPVEVSLGYVQLDRAYMISVARDITERRRAEHALSESKNQLEAVFNAVQDGILAADIQTKRFRMGNTAICRMLGYSLDELLNLRIEDLHREEDIANVGRQFERQLKGESSLSTLPMKRKDGTVFYADITAAPMTMDGQSFFIGVFRDITERRQAETKLAEQFNELQRWNEAMQGREMRILDLKHEVNELLGQTGQPPRYPSAESDGQTEG